MVVQKDPETGERLQDTLEIVEAGSKATVGPLTGIVVEPLSSEDTSDEWFRSNNPDVVELPPSTDTDPAPPVAVPLPVALTLTHVNPSEVTRGEDDNVVLTGSGFTDVVEVFVGTERVMEFFVTKDTTLYFNARFLNETGTVDVRVTNNVGTHATLSDALSITEPAIVEEPVPSQDTSPNRY
jgi:hypothetical protein